MKLIKEEEDRVLYKTIEFETLQEKEEIGKKMSKEDWEDLDPSSNSLVVVFRKYIETNKQSINA